MSTKYEAEDLAGISEIADMAGVSRQAVVNWQFRHPDFPTPIAHLRATTVYSRAEVKAWLEKTGRIASADRALVGTARQGALPLSIGVGSTILLSVWNGEKFAEVRGTVELIEPGEDDDEVVYLAEDQDNAYFASQVVEVNGKLVTA